MRLHRSLFVVSACVLLPVIAAVAQSRKPGLYEITATMTWQHSPFPGGMAPGGGAHTTKVCVTQEQIDKYGDVPPQNHGNCQVTDMHKNGNHTTATMTCSAPMAGTGTIESTYVDADHSHSTVHFSGTMKMGPNSQDFEWTLDSTSTFKGADCGTVKPIEPRTR